MKLKKPLHCIIACLLLSVKTVLAQTLVTAPMTGTPSPGKYYNPSSLTLSPSFSFAATPGNSLHLYIRNGVCVPLAAAPSTNQNYVISYTIKEAGIANPSDPNNMTCQVTQSIKYIDGLGRTVQTIQVKGNQDGTKDLIQPISYDGFGREAVKYLPYTTDQGTGSYRTNAFADQSSFYNSSNSAANGVATITTPYAQTLFENSPLSRVTEQGAPGDPWQPYSTTDHTTKTEYLQNNNITWANDQLKSRLAVYYTAAINTDGSHTLVNSGTYADNELTVTVLKDENWVASDGRAGILEDYKDKEGHSVLKRQYNKKNGVLEVLSTYYVYDDKANLAYVLPPGTSPDLGSITSAQLTKFAYQYCYDERGRMAKKKLPGKEWETMIYNKLDQVVLSQDARQQLSNQWTVVKYDALGRVLLTGLWNAGSAISPGTLQASIYAAAQWDSRDYSNNTTANPTGYILSSYPQALNSYLTINYYDDYTAPGLPTIYNMPIGASAITHGMPTATKVAVLNNPSDMLWTVKYYDEQGRDVKTFSQHYLGGTLNVNNYDEVCMSYSFTSEVLSTTRKHHTAAISGGIAITISNHYTYDHLSRKIESWQRMNNEEDVMLSKAIYNEIGQLKTKKMANELQVTNYTYNERGWLKTQTAVQFSFELKYQDAINGMQANYNGIISNQVYTNGTSNTFNYTYDKLKRLISGASISMSETLTYDVMGNIATMDRDGGGTGTYNYLEGNRLDLITGGPLATGQYQYDENGNTKYDGRNGKTIGYNLLNLPETVSGGVTYTYDATGRKLRKQSAVTTDYIDGIQYSNGTIDFVQTEVGLARKSGNTFSYEYNLADHLGNVRASFYKNISNGQIDVIQRDNYYAFGKQKSEYIFSTENKYLYNGKEKQDELDNQYDYGARFYDPVVGRWLVVDPLAEKMPNQTPYKYGNNNPMMFIDPTGTLEVTGPYGAIVDIPAGDHWSTEDNIQVGNHTFGDMDAATPAIQNAMAKVESNASWAGSLAGQSGLGALFDDGGPGPQALTHRQELGKYGQIVTAYNLSFGASFAQIGGTIERGIIMTDKGWARRYQTIYYSPGFASPGGALGFTVVSPISKNYRPTFSDWKGAMVGFAAAGDDIAVNIGFTSTYFAWGIGYSFAPGSLKIPAIKEADIGASMNLGITTWTSPPYRVGNLNLPGAGQRYINTMTFQGGY